MTNLQKQANQAPKYTIELWPGVYVSEDLKDLTDKTAEAVQYSVGFDNEAIKVSYWSGVFGCDAKIVKL